MAPVRRVLHLLGGAVREADKREGSEGEPDAAATPHHSAPEPSPRAALRTLRGFSVPSTLQGHNGGVKIAARNNGEGGESVLEGANKQFSPRAVDNSSLEWTAVFIWRKRGCNASLGTLCNPPRCCSYLSFPPSLPFFPPPPNFLILYAPVL